MAVGTLAIAAAFAGVMLPAVSACVHVLQPGPLARRIQVGVSFDALAAAHTKPPAV
jgi:hypothetical protein